MRFMMSTSRASKALGSIVKPPLFPVCHRGVWYGACVPSARALSICAWIANTVMSLSGHIGFIMASSAFAPGFLHRTLAVRKSAQFATLQLRFDPSSLDLSVPLRSGTRRFFRRVESLVTGGLAPGAVGMAVRWCCACAPASLPCGVRRCLNRNRAASSRNLELPIYILSTRAESDAGRGGLLMSYE